jgi:hypothetical protein
LIVRRYAFTLGVLSSIPRAASGLAKLFIKQPTNFFPYPASLASCSGGFGERTLTVQAVRTAPRSTA